MSSVSVHLLHCGSWFNGLAKSLGISFSLFFCCGFFSYKIFFISLLDFILCIYLFSDANNYLPGLLYCFFTEGEHFAEKFGDRVVFTTEAVEAEKKPYELSIDGELVISMLTKVYHTYTYTCIVRYRRIPIETVLSAGLRMNLYWLVLESERGRTGVLQRRKVTPLVGVRVPSFHLLRSLKREK